MPPNSWEKEHYCLFFIHCQTLERKGIAAFSSCTTTRLLREQTLLPFLHTSPHSWEKWHCGLYVQCCTSSIPVPWSFIVIVKQYCLSCPKKFVARGMRDAKSVFVFAAGEPRGTSQQLARLEEGREEVERCLSAAEAKNGAAMMHHCSWLWKPSCDAGPL